MAEHHRYPEEPEPRRFAEQGPYDSAVYQRSDDGYRLPEQRGTEQPRRPFVEGVDPAGAASPYPGSEPYPATASYRKDDPLTTTGSLSRAALRDLVDEPTLAPPRSALDAIRVPLPPTTYPAVRPSGTLPSAATQPVSPLDPTGRPDPATGSTFEANRPPYEVYGGQGGRASGAHGSTGGPDEPAGTPAADDVDRLISERGGSGRRGADAVYRTGRPRTTIVLGAAVALLMVPVVRLLVQATFLDRPSAAAIVPAVLLTLGLPLTGVGLFAVAGSARAVQPQAFLRPPVGYLPVGLLLLLAAALATA